MGNGADSTVVGRPAASSQFADEIPGGCRSSFVSGLRFSDAVISFKIRCPLRGCALFFGRFGLPAVAGGERKMGGSAEDEAFARRERVLVLVRVDELVALFRRQVAHAADRPIDGLAAVGRQLPELLKDLARVLFLILRQVLPGLHAVEHAFLLLRRQAGKMLQSVLQPGLLLRWKPPELRIVFERAAGLSAVQIFIASKPVSGLPGLVLPAICFIWAAGVTASPFL